MIKVVSKGAGVVFTVRVSPGAAGTRVLGEHDGALKIAVAAPPERGKANKALLGFLAKVLGVRKSELRLLAGETSRVKKIAVEKADASRIRSRLVEIQPAE